MENPKKEEVIIKVKKGEMKKCNNCSKNEFLSEMVNCEKCKCAFYCNQ